MRRFAPTLALIGVTFALGVADAGAAIGPCPAQPGHRVFDRFEINPVDTVDAGIELEQVVAFPDGSVIAAGTRFTDDEAEAVLLRYRADGTPDPQFGHDGLALLPRSVFLTELTPLAALSDGGVALTAIAGPPGRRTLVVIRMTRTGATDAGFGDRGIVRVPGRLPAGVMLVVGHPGVLVGANYVVGRPPRMSRTIGRLILLSVHGRKRRRFTVSGGIGSLRAVTGGFQALVSTRRSVRLMRVRTSSVRKLRTFRQFLGGQIVSTRRGFWIHRVRSDGRIEFDLVNAAGMRRVVSRRPVPASLREFSAAAPDGEGLVAAADATSSTRRPGIVMLQPHGSVFEATACRVVWPDPFDLAVNDRPGGIVTGFATSGSHLVAIGQPFDGVTAVFSIRD